MDEMKDNSNLKEEKNISKDVDLSKTGFNISSLSVLIFIFCIFYTITVFISFKILKTRDLNALYKKQTVKTSKEKVAVIPVYGAIYKKEYYVSEKGSDFIVSMIKKYGENKDIKAIVLDINSPGGSVGAVQEIYSQIEKIKQKYKKPFVAYFGDVAASGAYYIASACDKIVTNPGTITGSIGVIFSFMQGDELFKKIGVKTNVIKSGKFKDIGSFSREMTKEEREILASMIEDTYNTFIDVVAKGRNMSIQKVKEVADGRIFTGRQALSLGLVDKIGDLDDAISEAGKMSGLGEKPQSIKAKPRLFDEIFSMIDSKLSFLKFENDYPMLEYRFIGL